MTSFVQTYTGGVIGCDAVEASRFELIDIVVGLANQPRFGGQYDPQYTWSVLHHTALASYLCAWGTPDSEYSDNLAMYGMLHDASEAYLGDMPTPWKRVLPDFCATEKRIQSAIFKQFGVKDLPECYMAFKHYDEQAMLVEAQHLSIDTTNWGYTADVNLQRPGNEFTRQLLTVGRAELIEQSLKFIGAIPK